MQPERRAKDRREASPVNRLLRALNSHIAETTDQDAPLFFSNLAQLLRAQLDAALVSIWDNRLDSSYLVLVASDPIRDLPMDFHAIDRTRSLTGLAAATKQVEFHEDIYAGAQGRTFANVATAKLFGLSSMVTIPVEVPRRFAGSTSYLLDMAFTATTQRHMRELRDNAADLARALGLAFAYVRAASLDSARRKIQRVAPVATSAAELFKMVAPLVQGHLAAAHVIMLGRQAGEPVVDASCDAPGLGEEDSATATTSDIEEIRDLANLAFESARAHLSRVEPAAMPAAAQMVVPVCDVTGEVRSVIACVGVVGQARLREFSSADLETVEAFADALAPYIERFHRIRRAADLLETLSAVTAVAFPSRSLNSILPDILATLGQRLNAFIGSIWVTERDQTRERLVLRAAIGAHEDLVGSAQYELGEGITGQIAAGRIVMLNTLDERRDFPGRRGKYTREEDVPFRVTRNAAFLGVPLPGRQGPVGALKLEYLQPSNSHPERTFTDEDLHVVQIAAAFIAYLIESDRGRSDLAVEYRSITQHCLTIANADTAEAAFEAAIQAFHDLGWRDSSAFVYDIRSHRLRLLGQNGTFVEGPEIDASGDHPAAVALREGQTLLIATEFTPHSRFIPIRLHDELFGTIHVLNGPSTNVEEQLTLDAISKHLSVVLSRVQNMTNALELTNQVVASSRFVVAEALSAFTVHSLNRVLEQILKDLKVDLARQEVKQRRELNETLSNWQIKLEVGKQNLEQVLRFVRREGEGELEVVDIHAIARSCIQTWYMLLKDHKCVAHINPQAVDSKCEIYRAAIQEILSVLIVNAVQAHARKIEIRTHNSDRVYIDRNFIRRAILVDCIDDGVGIAVDPPETIFNSNYTTKPDKFGTGLGLFIARRLAHDVGGDIIVADHTKSRGATLRVVLPVLTGGHK